MLLTFLMLGVALCLSAVAAFYSIVGLMAIFAAAAIPIAIMGSILEIAKLTVTVWLHEYWSQVNRTMKFYLVPAVGVLMLITSMGIFGFLSKAHLDQNIVSGDVQAKISIYDEKIRTAKDNIDANRKALKQMDEAVDQVMGRSSDEKGADKAVSIRRSQQKERARLQSEIATEQKTIASLNEESAPIRAEIRKVEAEVGPIKYIAALIYGDSADVNILEKAVRWVIIILVVVFDPLAVMMLLAATESFKWEKWGLHKRQEEKDYGADDVIEPTPTEDLDGHYVRDNVFVQPVAPPVDIPTEHWGGQDLSERIDKEPEPVNEPVFVEVPTFSEQVEEPKILAMGIDVVDRPGDYVTAPEEPIESVAEKAAKREWKEENPNDTLHRHERLLEEGRIAKLPWQSKVDAILAAQADDLPQMAHLDFGTKFPTQATKGDGFIRVDFLPSRLFKYNGQKWIEVDKQTTDAFAYNDEYIDYLIAKIGSGEYDPELLNEVEKQQIEDRLNKQG